MSQYGGSRGSQGSYGSRDDVSERFGRMNVNAGGSRESMYSQHSQTGRGGRGYNDDRRGYNDHQQNRPAQAPVAKKDLLYNTQVFADRPAELIQDKKIGEKMTLLTNHALVRLPEKTVLLNVYNVTLWQNNKEVVKREEAGPLFWKLLEANRGRFPNKNQFVYNDVNMLWSLQPFPQATTKITLPVRGKPTILIKYTGNIEFGSTVHHAQDPQLLSTLLDAIATSRIRDPHNRGVYTVFKHVTFLVEPNASEATMEDVALFTPTKWGVEARVGFSIAFKMNLRAGPTACFDLNHTLFNRAGYPLIRLFVEVARNQVITDQDFEDNYDRYLQDCRPDDLNRAIMAQILHKMSLRYSYETAQYNDGAERKTVGRHGEQSIDFKFYEIAGSADEEEFPLERDGLAPSVISVTRYYLEMHKIRLRYPHLPCIMKKPSKMNPNRRILFPLEFVSYVVNPNRYDGLTTEDMSARMIRDSAYTMDQRRVLLQHVIAQKTISRSRPIIDNQDTHMKGFGVKVEKEMLQVKSTLLPAPKVVYGNGKIHDKAHTGTWEAVRAEPMLEILKDGNVHRKDGNKKKCLIGVVICIDTPNSGMNKMDFDDECYRRLMMALAQTGQLIHCTNGNPTMLGKRYFKQEPHGESPLALRKYIQEVQSHVDSTYPSDGDVVVVPLFFLLFRTRCSMFARNEVYNIYNLLKYMGDNEQGVYSQGMLVDNFNRISANPATCMLTCHIVEKILGKIGTTHRKLDRSLTHKPWMTLTDPDSPTLVLGIDVSHPDDRSRKEGGIAALSVATIVGNIDKDVTQFRASSRIQDAGEEQVCRMETQIQHRIQEFVEHTKSNPAHIVVYRDGICEGDFQRTLYEERVSIEQACRQISPELQPTITYIVVSKRHHTKFFTTTKEEEIIKPGTLVEDGVTTAKYYDFYLSSQISEYGTARPTHYYVLYDTWAPMVSFWPTVTHALTYNFCRTTTTIALPSPVMYAHLAAKRAKEALDGAWRIKNFHFNDFQNVSALLELTKAIQTNSKLDGMTFV